MAESFPDPIRHSTDFLAWLWRYLSPKAGGGGGHRAHQFTINGLTYPFVRARNYASVPDVPLSRQYDMYSSLYLAAKGDLLFFFQADPQLRGAGIDARRGIRGIYRVTGEPYRIVEEVVDSDSGYKLLPKCPACQSPYATFSKRCAICDVPYPEVDVRGEPHAVRVLSLGLPIEPLVLFERSVSDERVYADFTDPGLVWIGRHDNAMGPGKGSSIRHLLPEEATKLARLLATESEQRIGPTSLEGRPAGQSVAHENGTPIEQLPAGSGGAVLREDELYFALTIQLKRADSPIVRLLSEIADVDWEDLEYVSSTFPWGYTSGAADYVMTFRSSQGRNLVILIECKAGSVHDRDVLQTVLYAERVAQVCSLSAPQSLLEVPMTVVPVLIGKSLRRPRLIPDPRIAIPGRWSRGLAYFGGNSVKLEVRPPEVLLYGDVRTQRAGSLDFRRLDSGKLNIDWQPDAGATGTAVEIDHILRNSWAEARSRAIQG